MCIGAVVIVFLVVVLVLAIAIPLALTLGSDSDEPKTLTGKMLISLLSNIVIAYFVYIESLRQTICKNSHALKDRAADLVRVANLLLNKYEVNIKVNILLN